MLALLLSQTLGLLHGIVHAPSAQALASASAARPAAPGSGSADLLLSLPFDKHQGDSDCRLFDQCSHADSLPTPAVPYLPGVPSLLALSVLAGLAVARWHAQFQARGPPSVR